MKDSSTTQHPSAPLFENPLWDIKKISEHLLIPVKTIRDWVYKKSIPFHKVGRQVRFCPSEIERWILERKNQCT